MATITPGSGATITAATAESFLPAAIWLVQALENDTARNPSAINNVTSSMSDDSQSLTASINFFATVTDDNAGNAIFTALDYLTTPSGQPAHWTAGSGGTIQASTIQGAIFECVRFIDNLENTSAKNPQAKKCVSYSITSASLGSATPSANISINITNFPLETTRAADGTQTVKGKDYLL